MRKLPEKTSDHAVDIPERREIEPHEGPSTIGPWFSFRHSRTEISSVAGSTRVSSRETRFENGRLTSESFEGELPSNVYHELVAQSQKLFVSQAAFLLGQLSLFLRPFRGSPGRDE